MISPTNAQMMLDRLIASDGWIDEKRFHAQRALLAWLSQCRFIDCLISAPNGYKYRVNFPKVWNKPATIWDLPNPGRYARAVRAARKWFRKNPTGRIQITPGVEKTLAQFNEWVWSALDRRINDRGGISDFTGRRCDDDYQMRLRRDSRRVQDRLTRRVIVHQFETDDARRRFAHLLADAA